MSGKAVIVESYLLSELYKTVFTIMHEQAHSRTHMCVCSCMSKIVTIISNFVEKSGLIYLSHLMLRNKNKT